MVAVASLNAWIWTWAINDWSAADGMLTVFKVIVMVDIVMDVNTFGWIRTWIA